MLLVSYEAFGSFEGALSEALRLTAACSHSIFGCDGKGFWLRLL